MDFVLYRILDKWDIQTKDNCDFVSLQSAIPCFLNSLINDSVLQLAILGPFHTCFRYPPFSKTQD